MGPSEQEEVGSMVCPQSHTLFIENIMAQKVEDHRCIGSGVGFRSMSKSLLSYGAFWVILNQSLPLNQSDLTVVGKTKGEKEQHMPP